MNCFELLCDAVENDNQKIIKMLYNKVRYNKDGTDKIECYFKRFRNQYHLEQDDILGIYDEEFWKACLKWAKKNKNVEFENKIFLRKFSTFVWINTLNRIKDFYYSRYGRKQQKKVFNESFVSVEEIIDYDVLDEIDVERLILMKYNAEQIANFYKKKGSRYGKIIDKLLNLDFNFDNIVSRGTLLKDFNQLTIIFNQKNM